MRKKISNEQKYKNQLIASREWKARNKEMVSAYAKIWNEANKALRKELKSKWDAENVEKRIEYNKKFKIDNPDYFKNKHLESTYGISIDEYNNKLIIQNNRCAICGKHESEINRGRLFVDHDHDTGKIRGLLCQKCNSALGMVDEDTDILFSMVSYLNEHK